MQLENYISDLLYRYECVIVPEFGAFITQHVPARIHETTNAFCPPKKIISFNEQIKHNDGLLTNYVADIEKIPFATASKKIQKRVSALKSFLTEGETLSLDTIGDLMLNNEGKITFEPSYSLNYLTDAFGLSQVFSPIVTREEPIIVARETYKEDVKIIEEKTPIAITPEKRKARPYLKYAALALIALTLGGIAMSGYYVNSIETHNKNAQQEANSQLESKIQEATFVISNPLPTLTLNVEKQTGNYHIVAGAYRIEGNSTKKVNQLINKGYSARKIGKNKYGLHEVVYSSYETRSEALKALWDIKRNDNREAWLLVKKLK